MKKLILVVTHTSHKKPSHGMSWISSCFFYFRMVKNRCLLKRHFWLAQPSLFTDGYYPMIFHTIQLYQKYTMIVWNSVISSTTDGKIESHYPIIIPLYIKNGGL